jgi:hypothetical protein
MTRVPRRVDAKNICIDRMNIGAPQTLRRCSKNKPVSSKSAGFNDPVRSPRGGIYIPRRGLLDDFTLRQ